MMIAERISWCRLCKPTVRKIGDSRGKILPGDRICQPVAGKPYVHTVCANRVVVREIQEETLRKWYEMTKEPEKALDRPESRCIKCGKNYVSDLYETCEGCYFE